MRFYYFNIITTTTTITKLITRIIIIIYLADSRIRARIKSIQGRFEKMEDAEEHFNLTLSGYLNNLCIKNDPCNVNATVPFTVLNPSLDTIL